jgi:Spy/CpxP family protein refolding chaperone
MTSVLLMSLFLAPAAYADHHEGHGMDMGKKLEKMKAELLLTPEQESQVKSILEDYKDRMKALKEEKHNRITAVLTPEQREKHENMMKEWKDKKKEMHEMEDES